MRRPPYLFRKGVFFCETGGFVFILDLKRNEYQCVTERDFNLLSSRIATRLGSPHLFNPNEEECHPAALSLLADFLEKEMLTVDPEQAQPDPTPMKCATNSLVDTVGESAVRPTLIQLARFAWAASHAHKCLKYRTLESIVRRVRLRKQSHPQTSAPFNLEEAASVLHAFETFRPLFPRAYLCIYDSLALLEFFAIHNLFPTWVFGIQAQPFEAHCWLQHENVVINDGIYRVSKFTPIMVV